MRESGFYWVNRDGRWVVCEWFLENTCWFVPGEMFQATDSLFQEIDENKLVRS